MGTMYICDHLSPDVAESPDNFLDSEFYTKTATKWQGRLSEDWRGDFIWGCVCIGGKKHLLIIVSFHENNVSFKDTFIMFVTSSLNSINSLSFCLSFAFQIATVLHAIASSRENQIRAKNGVHKAFCISTQMITDWKVSWKLTYGLMTSQIMMTLKVSLI